MSDVWVLGSTLEDARSHIEKHAALAGATPTSPLSRGYHGLPATAFVVTPGFVAMLANGESGMQGYATRLLRIASRAVLKGLA